MKRERRRGGSSLPPSIDPEFAEALSDRSEHKGRRRARRCDQKAQQLCRQVHRTLSMALAGECDDDLLRELTVEAVVPAGDSSHLVVRVSMPRIPVASLAVVMERLDRAMGRLRQSVAQAITRKRAPELTFVPVGREEVLL